MHEPAGVVENLSNSTEYPYSEDTVSEYPPLPPSLNDLYALCLLSFRCTPPNNPPPEKFRQILTHFVTFALDQINPPNIMRNLGRYLGILALCDFCWFQLICRYLAICDFSVSHEYP